MTSHDDEPDLENQVNVQLVDTPKTLSRQTSADEAQGPLVELDDSLDIPWSSLRPTMQAILWLSDKVSTETQGQIQNSTRL